MVALAVEQPAVEQPTIEQPAIEQLAVIQPDILHERRGNITRSKI